MNAADTTAERAAGAMRLGLRRLLRDFPFHAALVGQAAVEADPALDTMAVTVRGATLLLYSPAFACSCSLDELAGVLQHECNHVIFGHLMADPADYPDREARLIAEEITVNEWVRAPLPGRPILLADYPQLPPDEDTEARYARLAKAGGTDAKRWPCGPLNPLDDHSAWASARAAGAAGRLAIQVAARQALGGLTPGQRRSLPAALLGQIGRICGDSPGDVTETLPGGGRSATPVDWRAALRRFVARSVEVRPQFARPPRRFPRLAGVVPGRALRPGKAKVMAVIDTSGSVTPDLLARISAELDRLARLNEVIVVECDAAVQRTYTYRGPLDHVRGRGGTDLRPPLEPSFWRPLRPDVAVYFTDGYGPAHERQPGLPVLWCLVPNGQPPADWGKVVRIGERV